MIEIHFSSRPLFDRELCCPLSPRRLAYMPNISYATIWTVVGFRRTMRVYVRCGKAARFGYPDLFI